MDSTEFFNMDSIRMDSTCSLNMGSTVGSNNDLVRRPSSLFAVAGDIQTTDRVFGSFEVFGS